MFDCMFYFTCDRSLKHHAAAVIALCGCRRSGEMLMLTGMFCWRHAASPAAERSELSAMQCVGREIPANSSHCSYLPLLNVGVFLSSVAICCKNVTFTGQHLLLQP